MFPRPQFRQFQKQIENQFYFSMNREVTSRQAANRCIWGRDAHSLLLLGDVDK